MARAFHSEPDGWLQLRLRAVSHRLTRRIALSFPASVPMVLVLGFPKSGTTWVSQLIADALRLPYPRHALLPVAFASVMHGHELPTGKERYCVYVLRDGRDVMVSLYFHVKRQLGRRSDLALGGKLRRLRDRFDDWEDIRGNLPDFIAAQARESVGAHLSWGEHVHRGLAAPGAVPLRYEELRQAGLPALERTLSALVGEAPPVRLLEETLERFSFERQTGRSAGTQDGGSFLRRGVAGDWKNHFGREAGEVFDHHFGPALLEAGYEESRGWWEALK